MAEERRFCYELLESLSKNSTREIKEQAQIKHRLEKCTCSLKGRNSLIHVNLEVVRLVDAQEQKTGASDSRGHCPRGIPPTVRKNPTKLR
jgi:hypothetical protein